jgi:hypothetical protein
LAGRLPAMLLSLTTFSSLHVRPPAIAGCFKSKPAKLDLLRFLRHAEDIIPPTPIDEAADADVKEMFLQMRDQA